MWFNNKFFKYATGTFLVLLIIFMLGQVDFFIAPFRKLFMTVLTPLIVTGLLYFIVNPLVKQLERIKLPRTFAILISYVIIITFIGTIGTYMGSIIVHQFNQLIKELPNNIQFVKKISEQITGQPWFRYFDSVEIQEKLVKFLQNLAQGFTGSILGIAGKVTNIGTIVFIVPFILFYLLRDGEKFVKGLVKLAPDKYEERIKKIVLDVNGTLSSYILGQMTVALAIGIMMFTGYMIIKLKYALVLAIFAMITCIIPFFGPWIGILPAVLLSLTYDPIMAIKVFIVMQVVQTIDNNLISPHIMGKRLSVHPVTVILLLMVASSLYGIIGMILVIPAYAAIKVIVKDIYEMYTGKVLDFGEDIIFKKQVKNAGE